MPALGLLLIPGAVFFAGVLLVAFSQASSSTTRPAGEANSILNGLTWATDLIGQAWHRLVRSTTSRFAASHLVPLTRWFTSLNVLATQTARAVADVAEESARAVERLAGVVVPRETKRAVAPAKAAAKAAQHTATHAGAAAHTAAASTAKLRADVRPRVARAEHSIAVSLPQQIAHVNKRVTAVEHELRFPSRTTVSRWARRLWVGGLALIVIRSLVRRFPWLFCRKWKTLGPKVCRLDAGLIDDLFLGTVLLFGTVSLVEFVRDAQAVEEAALDALRGFIREA